MPDKSRKFKYKGLTMCIDIFPYYVVYPFMDCMYQWYHLHTGHRSLLNIYDTLEGEPSDHG